MKPPVCIATGNIAPREPKSGSRNGFGYEQPTRWAYLDPTTRYVDGPHIRLRPRHVGEELDVELALTSGSSAGADRPETTGCLCCITQAIQLGRSMSRWSSFPCRMTVSPAACRTVRAMSLTSSRSMRTNGRRAQATVGSRSSRLPSSSRAHVASTRSRRHRIGRRPRRRR